MGARRYALTLALLAVACALPAPAADAAAAIDPSYGEGGIFRLRPLLPLGGYPSEYSGESAAAPTGAAYFAIEVRPCRGRGEHRECAPLSTAILRLRPDGSLDRTFADRGTLLLGKAAKPTALAVDAAGRLLTVFNGGGTRGGGDRVVVRRYKRFGLPDRGFGHHGKVTVSGLDYARILLLDGRGRIVVGDSEFLERPGSRQEVRLARLSRNGHRDRTFARDGSATYFLPGTPGTWASARVAPDGAIFVPGETCCTSSIVAISRISPSGRLDRGFERRALSAQVRLLKRVREPEPFGILPRPHGELDVFGPTFSENFRGDRERGFLLRLRADGHPDRSFGHGGLVRVGRRIVDAAPGRDGSTFLVSETSFVDDLLGHAWVARLRADGRPDLAFNGPGWLKMPARGNGVYATPLAAGGVLIRNDGYRQCDCLSQPYFVRIGEGASG